MSRAFVFMDHGVCIDDLNMYKELHQVTAEGSVVQWLQEFQ
jgi:hypothetical protein